MQFHERVLVSYIADDIILLAHTSYAMQKMLDVCSEESISLELKFNVNKSVALRVGPRWRSLCAPLTLGFTDLRFVDSTKYLGVYLKSGVKYSCSYGHLKSRFYSCFNALFSSSKASNSELVTTELLKTFCIPVLTYALEVTDPNRTVTSMLNNLINRIFIYITPIEKYVVLLRRAERLSIYRLHGAVLQSLRLLKLLLHMWLTNRDSFPYWLPTAAKRLSIRRDKEYTSVHLVSRKAIKFY